MAKMTKAQLKELLGQAYQIKNEGGSLSKLFEDFANKTGRAKGSIRNVYYTTLQKMSEDKEYMKEMLSGKNLEATKIIGFEDGESDLLLRRILTGATFGKSVRRVICEMTDNPKLALRYQNKYRNLLKHDRERVDKIRQEIIEDYGKCFEPYKERANLEGLERLKKEINSLYDKIADDVKQENKKLKEKIKRLEEDNSRLAGLLKENKEGAIKSYFKSAILEKKDV